MDPPPAMDEYEYETFDGVLAGRDGMYLIGHLGPAFLTIEESVTGVPSTLTVRIPYGEFAGKLMERSLKVRGVPPTVALAGPTTLGLASTPVLYRWMWEAPEGLRDKSIVLDEAQLTDALYPPEPNRSKPQRTSRRVVDASGGDRPMGVGPQNVASMGFDVDRLEGPPPRSARGEASAWMDEILQPPEPPPRKRPPQDRVGPDT